MGYSHSNSENTKISYRYNFKNFLNFAGTTANQILEEYENLDDKKFKRKYTSIIMSYLGKLQKEQFAPSTIQIAVNTVKSFFKYNSLPLNFIPSGRQFTMFHNRDIIKEEIEAIIKDAQPREKAYYALMTQSGLRPNEISNLKIENLENLLENDTPIPCLIKIQQEITKGKYQEYFTFTGQESINYIKEYLKREREQPLTPEEYLFTMTDGKTKTKPDLISHIFRRTVKKLQKENVLKFKNIQGEKANRNELRLYNLRKYFRNHAGKAGTDFVNFWMGHSLGIDAHYFSQTDIPQHRKQYQDLAMKNLRIETKTPDQNESTIAELQTRITEREKQNQELKDQLESQQKQITKILELLDRVMKGEKFTLIPVDDKTAEGELITTPEERQIDLTPNQANLKLRKKLCQETTKPEKENPTANNQ